MAALANDYSFKQPDCRFYFFLNNLQQRGVTGYKRKKEKQEPLPRPYASNKDAESFEKEPLSLSELQSVCFNLLAREPFLQARLSGVQSCFRLHC